jgi:eukaryotic-like serine/threonine-protein kinase
MPASTDPNKKELYEFGPFRVDPEREMVVREGEPVPLTPKNFQILLALVRHNREVVTKDDLMKKVWPDTFVEEANLSRNIFMLRKALGETAQDRRYIVTVPGCGYRLAESVRLVADQEVTVIAASHSRVQVESKESRPWLWIAAVTLLLAIAGVFAARTFLPRSAALKPTDSVVLADFANSTGDPVFDGTLRQGLAVELEQSPFLSLVPEDRIHLNLRLAGADPDAPMTPALARTICERVGGTAVMEGSIANLGSRYVLGLRARNCRSGEMIDDEQEQVARKEDLLDALSRMAARFRSRVGESLATIKLHDIPLAEATTPSLEALKAYSSGWDIHFRSGATASIPFFQRAVDLDPKFAIAHASLGRAYSDLDQYEQAARSAETAWRLRDRASDRERFFITAIYQILVTGNVDQARQTCETWARTYPRDEVPHSWLAGWLNKTAGRFEVAAGEAQKAIEINPDRGMAYYSFAVDNAYQNRFDDAEAILRQAEARGLQIDEFYMLRHDIAFIEGDRAAMDRVAAQARQRSGTDGWVTNKEALAAAYAGRLAEARSLTRRAVEASLHIGQPERAALWLMGAAVREALVLNPTEARKQAKAALALSRSREIEYGAALAYAMSGETAQAQALAADLEKQFPDDTLVRFNFLPTLRAQFALARGNPAEAVELLQIAAPYEMSPARGLIGGQYPIYVRGLAYLALHREAAATGEFQKILNHRGIVVSDPVGAMALVQLARANSASRNAAGAKSAYRSFLSLWVGADSDLPILLAAKRESEEQP